MRPSGAHLEPARSRAPARSRSGTWRDWRRREAGQEGGDRPPLDAGTARPAKTVPRVSPRSGQDGPGGEDEEAEEIGGEERDGGEEVGMGRAAGHGRVVSSQ